MKRTGYFATYEGEPRPTKTLAYSEQQARRLFDTYKTHKTYTWHGTQHPAKARVASGSHRLDRSAIGRATAELGLKLPVDIKYNSKVGSTGGTYRLKDGRHHIVIKSYLDPVKASEVLWHELTHARQCEDVGATQIAWNNHPGRRRGQYRYEPVEVEARKVAAEAIAAGKFLAR